VRSGEAWRRPCELWAAAAADGRQRAPLGPGPPHAATGTGARLERTTPLPTAASWWVV